MSHLPALARVRIVLCRARHPGNIGAAARAMRTMGVDRLFLVAPQRFPDPEASALASRATDVLDRAKVCESLDEALAGCVATYGFTARPRESIARSLPVRAAAAEALSQCPAGDVALVFGNETYGLTNAELERCSALAYIPTDGDYASLNLGAAVQVACYELRAATGQSGPDAPRRTPATSDDIEHLHAHARRTLVELGFLDPQHPRRLLPRLRRLFGRARLEREEVAILRGILSQVDQALALESRAPVRICANCGGRVGSAFCGHCGGAMNDRSPTD